MVLVMDLQQAVSLVRGGREGSWNLWEMPNRTERTVPTAADARESTNTFEQIQRNVELPAQREKGSSGPKATLPTILSAYGIACNIASQLDRNTQHALSLTCREIYETVKTSRALMARQSLRCCKDTAIQPPGKKEAASSCARDLVRDCIKCSQPVCRNCIVKPRFVKYKENRYQRLCSTCAEASLIELQAEQFPPPPQGTVAYDAFVSQPCNCEEIAWVCASCGPRLLEKDRQYMTSWEWIRRYSESMEGIIEQGKIRCARGERCLAAETILIEVDSDAVDRAGSASPKEPGPLTLRDSADETASSGLLTGSPPNRGPGYFRQEIMGIGGVIKQKSWQNLTVGGLVTFFGDFYANDRCGREAIVLEREKKGEGRSWCGWCDRVIPAKKEVAVDGCDESSCVSESICSASPKNDQANTTTESANSGQEISSKAPGRTHSDTARAGSSSHSGSAHVQPNWSADYLDDHVFLDSNVESDASSSRPHNGGFYGFSEGSRSQRDLVNSLSNPK